MGVEVEITLPEESHALLEARARAEGRPLGEVIEGLVRPGGEGSPATRAATWATTRRRPCRRRRL